MTRASNSFASLLFVCCLVALFSSTVAASGRSKTLHAARKTGKTTATTTSNSTDVFCQEFTAECYHKALHGKKGKVQILHACKHNSNKHPESYSFSCKANGKDITKTVLEAIGSGYTVTTTASSTAAVTETVSVEATSTSLSTSTVDATSTLLSTSSTATTTVATDTSIVGPTETLTTVILQTATSTSTSTITTTVPVTETSFVSTSTSYYLSNEPIQVFEVYVAPGAKHRKRVNRLDKSSFCSAFNAGCSSQCTLAQSTAKHVICHATSSNHYSLACQCKNGKSETKHALAAAAEQEHVVTVSTVSTSTSYATVTATSVVPSTVLTTSTATVTSTVPVTKTYTSSSTVTQTSTSTAFTGLSVTLTTLVPTASTTATATSTTTTQTVTTTTIVVLAPTGAVQMIYQGDGTSLGYLAPGFPLNTVNQDRTQAYNFMAVQDPTTELIQLQLADASGRVFISEQYGYGVDYNDRSAFSYTYVDQSSLCGSAGGAPGPAAGAGSLDGQPCETFVFGPTPDATTGMFDLLSYWINPEREAPQQYIWAYDYYNYANILNQAASISGFQSTAGTQDIDSVTLRFPA
ncbi:hypothetical protein CBS101457_004978 [Exobasidium rhododendri]|nr:hypothetical protein CBS101457_004978 [Exobasidium rhododendri]